MKSVKSSAPRSAPRREEAQKRSELTQRYGRIGIPAVAAALPYQTRKNPAYARTEQQRFDARFADATT